MLAPIYWIGRHCKNSISRAHTPEEVRWFITPIFMRSDSILFYRFAQHLITISSRQKSNDPAWSLTDSQGYDDKQFLRLDACIDLVIKWCNMSLEKRNIHRSSAGEHSLFWLFRRSTWNFSRAEMRRRSFKGDINCSKMKPVWVGKPKWADGIIKFTMEKPSLWHGSAFAVFDAPKSQPIRITALCQVFRF